MNKRTVTFFGIIITCLMIIGDVSYALADTSYNPYENANILPLESINNPQSVIKVLEGQSSSEELDSSTKGMQISHIMKTNHELLGIADAGQHFNNYDPEFTSELEIEKINRVLIESDTDLQETATSTSIQEYFRPGLLQHVVHTVNETGIGRVFLDSTATTYNLDAEGIISDLTKYAPSTYRDGHFGMVVFVSDYKSRGIEKLQENKVWLQTYDRLFTWLGETSDYYTMLVNEYPTPDNIMSLLAEAEKNEGINSIGLTIVSHGVNSIYGHWCSNSSQ